MAQVPQGYVGVYDVNGYLLGMVPQGTALPQGAQTIGPGSELTPTIGGAQASTFGPTPSQTAASQPVLTNQTAVTATPVTPPSGASQGSTGGASSAGNAGGSGGMGTSSASSNAGFSGLTTSGTNTGTTTVPNPQVAASGQNTGTGLMGPQTPYTTTGAGAVNTNPTINMPTNPPATGTTGTPSVGSSQSGFSGLTGTGSGAGVGTSANTAAGGTAAPSSWNAQQYLAEHPDLINNWNNSNGGYAQMYGSIENYALADAKVNGGQKWQSVALTYQQPTNPSYTPATVPANSGNYNQQQNAAQTGQFATQGTQNVSQQQQTGQTTDQTQTGQVGTTQQGTTQTTGTQQQTGGQTQQTAQQGVTTGTTTSAPTDVLGFGKLLQQQAQGVAGTDAARQGFLSDVMNTGGQQFQSQVDQAVRNSLTGPQMTGAGDSARARAAGYAGAQVARNNLDERLSAANQLAGQTGLSTLSSAAAPYGVGQQQTTTGTTNQTGTSSGTNFSNLVSDQTVNNLVNSLQNSKNTTTGNTTGFSNLTGSTTEGQSGTATGQSSQAAAGQIPSAQTVSTGGGACVLCTAATELGLYNNPRVLRRVINYKLNVAKNVFAPAARGYFFLFTPVARWLLDHPRVARALYPMARAVVYEELRVSGRKLPRRTWASFVHWSGHFLCHVVGKLPVPKVVLDREIERIARKNDVWFELS